MRAGIAASTLLHAGVLVLTLVSFTGAKPFEPMPESLPVDVISISDYTKLTKGARNAPKADAPKQIAEKVGDPTPVEDAKLKASEKPPVEATAPPPPPPPPPPKVEPTPKEAAPAKVEPTPPKEQAELAPKPEQKKQEQPKDEAKTEAAAAPLPPRKPAPPREQPKPVEANAAPSEFNTDQIKQLLDKRTPSRQVASAEQVSTTSSLGSPRGDGQQLTASEIDAFRRRVMECWSTDGGNLDRNINVDVDIYLNKDGSLSAAPRIAPGQPGAGQPAFQAYAMNGIRAIMACQPYKMFRPETYAEWKTLPIRLNDRLFSR
ncbi:cell envelope biogenesis protein TolA [Xanthobacter sp. AM33]|uniref:cell envelope biogenesis protein TolA n=1 Tax=Xanthobacter sp. AM33 TaxID=3380644 RepID=UPI0039BFF3B9